MKNRNVLSGITALLLVGTFYSFAFCMVEDVDDQPVPMEYYYSTETDADTGERNGEATSAFDAMSFSPSALKTPEKTEKKHVTAPPAEEDTASAEALETVLPEKKKPEIPEEELSYDSGDDAPEDISDDEPAADESKDAEDKNVFADNEAEDEYLYKFDADMTEAEELREDTDEDRSVTVTYNGDNSSSKNAGSTGNDDRAPAPGKDIVLDLTSPVVTETVPETAGTKPEPEPAPAPVAGETFTARYNGSVHTVDAYELVCMIVNNEISTYFSDEAIKAQAVAAYSYVKYHNVNGLTPTVLVKKDPPKRIKDMVSSVWGVCCYYNGSVAQTVYMASSSGYTASSENVWGGAVPYLVSVPCPFDSESDPNYGVQTKFSKETVRSALESYLGITLSGDPSNWLRVTSYIDGNYVSEVSVDGQKTISGRKLRENILNYQLRSASFNVAYYDGSFVFTTYGYGHGVGMSQNGANILAGKGYSYTEILKYYYTGIDVR